MNGSASIVNIQCGWNCSLASWLGCSLPPLSPLHDEPEAPKVSLAHVFQKHTENGVEQKATVPGDSGGQVSREMEKWGNRNTDRLPAFRNLEIKKGGGADLERQFCEFLHELKEVRINIKWTT